MIFELLEYGADHAKTAKTLATQLGWDKRKVSRCIEHERRQGKPICAVSNGKNKGYYLAACPEELSDYCGRLLHRGGELFATRRALLNVLKQLEVQKADGTEDNGNG